MKKLILFTRNSLNAKMSFQTEIGRLLFARLVSAQRSNSKRVNETTFYSLIQHFAIVLFECNETDDFSPAKILMNMCFTFFYEGIFMHFMIENSAAVRHFSDSKLFSHARHWKQLKCQAVNHIASICFRIYVSNRFGKQYGFGMQPISMLYNVSAVTVPFRKRLV